MLEQLNSTFTNIIFLNKELFLLFLIVPVFVYSKVRNNKTGIKFKFIKDLEKIYSNLKYINYLKLILEILIISSFILIIANPVKIQKNSETIKNGIDIDIVLDISASMLAEDITPNRLEWAKKVIANFVSKNESNRIWLTIFAWRPFVFSPLTFDYNNLVSIVNKLTIQSINQNLPGLSGTSTWDWLLVAIEKLEKEPQREKAIILVTDWEANMWVDPTIVAKLAKEKKIKIYTIWIWTKEWIPLAVTNSLGKNFIMPGTNGQPLIVKLNEEQLKKIAKESNGYYFNASNKNELENIFKQLEKLDKKDIKVKDNISYSPYYYPFVVILSIFFVIYLWLNLMFKIEE